MGLVGARILIVAACLILFGLPLHQSRWGKDGLFPEPREMRLGCSCPDQAGLCKHLAAVLYGIGIRLDTKPELFFVLRQVDQAELLSSATGGALPRARPVQGKRIADDRLSAVFGIDLDVAPSARPGLKQRRPRSGSS